MLLSANEAGPHMELSPELDLLEQLSGGDLSLDAANRLFPTAGRFNRVVEIYCRSGAVKLIETIDGGDRPVELWELRRLLADTTGPAGRNPLDGYRLALTPQGYNQFAADSQAFYKELFGR